MPIVENDVERFEAAQLVADLRDLDLVQKVLQEHKELQITSRRVRVSRSLDLALLELPNLDSEIGGLRKDSELVKDAINDRLHWLQAFRRDVKAESIKLTDEDLVVFALRRYFRRQYRGWSPTFDKHHIVERITGWPYHKGSTGEPDEVEHVDIPPRTGRPGPRVGIADTAIYPHDDLVGRYVGDQTGELPRPARPAMAHATFIAGLILQRAPDAELVVREVLGGDGVNRSSWDVAVKLMEFLHEDVSVLNMSFGCLTADSLPPLILRRAVERLSRAMVLVAAAGNNGNLPGRSEAGVTAETPAWPAGFDDVVAVGAYDPSQTEQLRAPFSPHVQLVDLLAPGVRVRSTFLPGEVRVRKVDPTSGELLDGFDIKTFDEPGYAEWDGTSFAAAGVSGEIAARMSAWQMSAQEALDGLLPLSSDIIVYPPEVLGDGDA
jgi:Subtilase family